METIKAWQCIGCGKLDAPQTCIGVCQDRRVELVYASEYSARLGELTHMREQRDALHALVRRVAGLDPGDAVALAALRDDACTILAKVERDEAAQAAAGAGTSGALPSPAPADASGPLRDRRDGAAAQKPRLTRPATLFVR